VECRPTLTVNTGSTIYAYRSPPVNRGLPLVATYGSRAIRVMKCAEPRRHVRLAAPVV
jgi:hypothetical protein